MSGDKKDGGNRRPEPEDGLVEVQDTGQTLESVLDEEEQSALASAEEKLQSVRKDLEDLKDRHLRKLAEFETMRKRAERERSEYFRHALGNFLRDLIPIVDGFDRALEHADPEARGSDFGQGVAMIRQQVDELWRKYGVREVDTSQPFDPNVHEAVATEPRGDVAKDTILEVLRKGYFLNDRLLRPALVKVAVPPTDEAGRESEIGNRKSK